MAESWGVFLCDKCTLRRTVGNIVTYHWAGWGRGGRVLCLLLSHTTNHVVACVKYWYRHDSLLISHPYKMLKVKGYRKCFTKERCPAIVQSKYSTCCERCYARILLFLTTHCSLKAYCAILVRRSIFRHQTSPRVSPRQSTQRRKVELWGRNIR